MDKLEIAKSAYLNGYTCSQAVLKAFINEIDIDEKTALQMIEGLGGGVGGLQEICGAFSAAAIIISYYYGNEQPDMIKRAELYQIIQKMADVFKQKCCGLTCLEILKGEKPAPGRCQDKVNYAVEAA